MTNTPEQYRVLADRAVQADDGHMYSVPARDLVEYNKALRAAADEIEHLKRWQYHARWESSDVGDYADRALLEDGTSDD